MKKRTDITGNKYGKLLVTGYDSDYISPKGQKLAVVKCVCDCGKQKSILQMSVLSGHTRSCGCLNKESYGGWFDTHGMSKTPEYRIWKNIKGRCFNKHYTAYRHYGGRGVSMSEDWKNSFETFISDMGKRPSNKHSIERKDLDGNYGKDNCVWATHEYQSRNRRKRIDNTSGKTGVYYREDRNSYDIVWMELDGTRRYKTFSIKKYGENTFKVASDYRDSIIAEMNKNGAGYSEKHGK